MNLSTMTLMRICLSRRRRRGGLRAAVRLRMEEKRERRNQETRKGGGKCFSQFSSYGGTNCYLEQGTCVHLQFWLTFLTNFYVYTLYLYLFMFIRFCNTSIMQFSHFFTTKIQFLIYLIYFLVLLFVIVSITIGYLN